MKNSFYIGTGTDNIIKIPTYSTSKQAFGKKKFSSIYFGLLFHAPRSASEHQVQIQIQVSQINAEPVRFQDSVI